MAGLNGCSWIPGATIGSVTATSPIIASLGSCTSNTGTGVNLSLSLGGIVPNANLPAVVAFTGLTSQANGSTAGWVPPVYTNAGLGQGTTEHIVRGQLTLAIPNGSTTSNGTVVTFSGAAAFTTVGTYEITAQINYGASSYPAGWNSNANVIVLSKSATTVNFLVTDAPAVSTAAGGSVVIDYIAVGA